MLDKHFHARNISRSVATSMFVFCLIISGPSIATDLPSFGGNGGNPFRLLCPPDSYLSGFNGRSGDYVDRLQLVCAHWNGQDLDSVQFPEAFVGLSRGGRSQQAICPEQHVVHGADFSTLASDNALLDEFSFECIFLKRPAPNGPRLNFTSTGSRGGWSFGGESGWNFCPQNEVAVGIYGKSGDFIDRIGIVCDLTPEAKQNRRLKIIAGLIAIFGLGTLLLQRSARIKKKK